MTATCERCGAAADTGAAFCEACGVRLPVAGTTAGPTTTPATTPAVDLAAAQDPPAAPAAPPGPADGRAVCADPRCGGSIADDGYCERCGAKATDPRDHVVTAPAPWAAGVCDRGVVHERNEDAIAVAASGEPGRFAVLVVCDGVSSAPRSNEASLAAADAAAAVLSAAGPTTGPGPRSAPDWAAVLDAAARAGDEAVGRVAGPIPPGAHDCPSCTFVAAVVDDGRIVAASVGDSRAYWLADDGPAVPLTTDDSWAQEMIAAGMPREQAEASPRAHAITRWLGPDSPPVATRAVDLDVPGPGWLLVCSDGLWNYCSAADELAALVQRTAAEHDQDPAATAGALVSWVNSRGGRDNVSVVLARLEHARTR